MSKDLNLAILVDLYRPLLTEKQQETLEMYYDSDLSLGEISEETGITRQGVMNCVKKCEARLVELEEKMALAKRLDTLEKERDALEAILKQESENGQLTAAVKEQLTIIKNSL